MKTLLLLGILLTGCKIGTATFDGLTGGDGATGPIPPKPTDLNLSDPEEGVLNLSWVHGAEAFSTFVFKWKNPTENFDHAEVTMSWRDSNGSIERRDYILPNEPESHTFTSIMLEECVRTYFPTVRAVGPQGAVSEPEYSPQNIRYDNTNPQPVTKINVFENDGETPGKAVTADWSGGPGSDNCGIDHYEIAIGYDADSNNELDPIEIKNVLNFTRIPGEKGGVKSFQAVDGYTFTDEKGATHTFLFKEPLQEDVDYFTTIRVVDGAGFFIDSSPSLRWIALPGPTIGFPPDPPTNLSLSSSWITGNPPVPSPEFSWTNPSGNFSHVEVSLGVYIENELIFNTDYEKALNPQSHIFTKFLLIQCSGFYVPKAISVNSLGNKSRSVVYFDGFRYDNTNPTPVTFIDVSKIDGIVNETVFKANTVDWSTGPGSDNCGIAKYEMAIGLDANSNGVLDPGEQIDDVQPFQVIPGGNDITRYQAESGEDGFNFTLESGKKYFTSIKIFDGAGLSSLVFTSEVWDTPGSGKPLDPPTELALSSKWVRGYDLVSSPLFTWVNPGENEFSHAVVNLGIIDEENGTTTFLGSESLGPGDNNHIFINFPLKECRNLYFPMVSSVTDQGIQSEPNLFFDGFRYDNTSPTPVTNIDVSAQDSSLTDDMDDITRAPTTTWSPGADNCSGIKYFEIAIGTSPSDIESILSFIKVPGGDMTTSFQVVDGEVLTYEEGATYTVSFKGDLEEGVDYYTSIKAVDNAGNISGQTTSLSWRGEIFSPEDLASMTFWFDVADASTLIQDSSCTGTQAVSTVKGTYNPRLWNDSSIPIESRVGCVLDKSTNSNNAIPLTSGDIVDNNYKKRPVYLSDGFLSLPAIHIFGTTKDGLESGPARAQGGNPLSVLLANSDSDPKTIFFVGDFSQISASNFNNATFFRGPKLYLRQLDTYFRDDGFNKVLSASKDGVDGKLITLRHAPALASPTENLSSKEIFIHGEEDLDYKVLTSLNDATSTRFTIGGYWSGGNSPVKDAFLSELIFFNHVLTDEERRKVEGYLSCKWDLRQLLPSSHPYSPNAEVDLGCPFEKN